MYRGLHGDRTSALPPALHPYEDLQRTTQCRSLANCQYRHNLSGLATYSEISSSLHTIQLIEHHQVLSPLLLQYCLQDLFLVNHLHVLLPLLRSSHYDRTDWIVDPPQLSYYEDLLPRFGERKERSD